MNNLFKGTGLIGQFRQYLCLFLLSLSLTLALSGNACAAQKIEFWTMSLKPKFIPYFQEVVKTYEAQHPGIKLEWVDFPWDILQLKLITAIAAGTPPALVNLSVPWAEEMARDGLLEPVDAWLTAPDASNDYTDAALADLRFNGKVYGFPHYSNVNVIAYNRKMLAAAGITQAPKSMDELLAQAALIASKTGKPGYAPALGKIDGFFMQQGLELMHDGRAVFNSPAHIMLLKKLAATYKAGGFLKDKLFAEDNFPAVVDAYLGGRLGVMVSAPTAIRRIQTDAPDIYAQTGIFPVPPGPTGINDGGWMFHFAIPKGVKKKDLPEVAAFARFLTSDANQLAFARLAGVMPTTKQALANPYFKKIPANAGASEQALAVAANSMNAARSLYVSGIDDYDELRRFLVKAVEAGVTGKRDIQEAMDEAVVIWNRKLQALKQP
ncbi:sugar ABC transporter substrate-binding protein [Undibacterium sp. TS12]|uniref:ABC transporter substrate-binding protein n=1 Tax=Undibacterium sp. TS12 TaxID=2908202 RepID=UPI001F4CB3FF|nr:sugar ABC transporter substrate-binding protein [Undibacterium sp. TS12]MCH8622758.1 sugar ABC transporter substrate-binding protein [Undibacterium sp. TS12]